jgi:hypothetical protein
MVMASSIKQVVPYDTIVITEIGSHIKRMPPSIRAPHLWLLSNWLLNGAQDYA